MVEDLDSKSSSLLPKSSNQPNYYFHELSILSIICRWSLLPSFFFINLVSVYFLLKLIATVACYFDTWCTIGLSQALSVP